MIPSQSFRARSIPDLPSSWLDPIRSAPAGEPGRSLPSRILPGPMEGITRGSFCRIMGARGLVPCWITPFLRLSDTVPRLSRLQRILGPYLDSGKPVVVQLMGTKPDVLAEVARLCLTAGAVGVDFNAACPSRTVLRRGAGGALLREPAKISGILKRLREVCASLGGLCSIKLRTGRTSPAEFADIAAAVREGRPDFVVLHFRTVREAYRPIADGVQRLARARELLPEMVLIGSGDLFRLEDAARMAAAARVDGVAPARGLVRDPLLLKRIAAACAGTPPPPAWTIEQRLDFLHAIVADALASGGRHTGFAIELARHLFAESPEVLQELMDCRELAAMVRVCAGMGSAVGGPEPSP